MEPIALAALISLSALGGAPAPQAAATQNAPSQAAPVPTQETPARVRARTATQSLNQSPADSTLGQTPALPPLAPRPRPAAPATSTPAPAPVRAAPIAPSARPAPAQSPAPRAPAANAGGDPADAAGLDVAALAGPASALPPLALGYYVRGELDCNQVWPGEGDLAWLSATSFVLDFGGCEPGAIQQVSDAIWREDQQCMTELGGDGGAFSVGYEVRSATVMARTTRLALDSSEQQDIWTHCAAEAVPEEARFQS